MLIATHHVSDTFCCLHDPRKSSLFLNHLKFSSSLRDSVLPRKKRDIGFSFFRILLYLVLNTDKKLPALVAFITNEPSACFPADRLPEKSNSTICDSPFSREKTYLTGWLKGNAGVFQSPTQRVTFLALRNIKGNRYSETLHSQDSI